ncbi:PorP/SprF family type IX secretion system membrane protein [Tenacibaculum sp. nBUS_03]|uniref:PorP/SprF family type IX secretion system membrane protein n=1 Tax=Tenacibaculum sp. nBUS_03 TaxID=3395320 RepID=UPI003EB84CDF
MKLYNIKYTLTLLVIMVCVKVQGQQDPSFTMYNLNMNIINPAYAGSSDGVELTTLIRGQWLGIENAPNTQTLSISSPVGKNLGLGLSIVNDQVFIAKETDVYIDVSYKLKLSENNDLFLGLKAGASFFNTDLNSLNIQDPLYNQNVNRVNPNFGAGAYLKGKNYYVSLSVPVLLQSDRYEKEGNVVTSASDTPHIYLGAGYTFDLENDYNLKVTPSFMTRYVDGVPLSVDLTATISLLNKVEFGISHRLKESLSGLLMFKFIKEFKMGYAYEHATNDISKYSSGSHEFVFKFQF